MTNVLSYPIIYLKSNWHQGEEQCCLAYCTKAHFVGMQALLRNREEKEKGEMGFTTAFNGNGMMAPHPLLHGLSQ